MTFLVCDLDLKVKPRGSFGTENNFRRVSTTRSKINEKSIHVSLFYKGLSKTYIKYPLTERKDEKTHVRTYERTNGKAYNLYPST